LGVDEAALVRLALGGDNDALEQLLTAHLPGLVRMLRRLVPTQADAEDLAQETCLHALTGLPGLRRPELFGAWLRTIAYNRARQWQRRRYAEAATWPRLWQPEEDDGPDPGDRADTRAALGLLSPSDRDAVVLRYVGGWSSSEIARLQGKAPGTIRWRLHRALERLRTTLSESDEE
jgi:RNA polymerase sigma-70 factor, ECF subfamily